MLLPAPSAALSGWFEIASWVGALIAVLIALREFNASRKQRVVEQNWRETEAAMKLIDEMVEDEDYRLAALLLDSGPGEVEIPKHGRVQIKPTTIQEALLTPEPEGVQARICYAFDGLFYHIAKFQHYITRGLITANDVDFPIAYYIGRLAPYRTAVVEYLNRNQLVRAQTFLNKNAIWLRMEGSNTPRS